MAQRPKGTYVSQVINPGIQKDIPAGVVDVVYSKNGDAVGYMRDGEFYELGTKPKAKKPAPKKPRVVDNVPTINDERAAKSERDTLSKQIADMEIRGEEGTPAYQETVNAYERAQERVDTIEEALSKYRGKKKATRESQRKERDARTIEAERKDAERRGDTTKAKELQRELSAMGATPTGEAFREPMADTGIAATTTKAEVTTKKGKAGKGGVAGGTGGVGGTGGTGGTAGKTPKGKKYTIDEIYSLVQNEYGPIDLTFKSDPELKDLLFRAVGADAKPGTKDDFTSQRFLNELQQTKWWQTNSGPLRQRQFYKNQYEEMRRTADPETVARLDQTSEYGRGLTVAKQNIADAAKQYGATISNEDLDILGRQIYDLGYENTPSLVAAAIRGKISYAPGATLGGQAGESLRGLEATAAANGIDLQKQFGNNLQGWLQNIAQGESVETYKQIIRERAKLGLPDKVASLVDKGVDLQTIYDPYKQMMASVLEVNPETIKLDDPTLRMAIGPDKEMSLYDYQRTLRKDPRWQYTNNARQEVSSIAQQVLRDFGFQG
jgi:hypothetical protein